MPQNVNTWDDKGAAQIDRVVAMVLRKAQPFLIHQPRHHKHGGGGGGNLYHGTIVADSIDCDATPRTLDVDFEYAPACSVPGGTGDDSRRITGVIDPGDEIGRFSMEMGGPLSQIYGSFVSVAKQKRLSDCADVWVLEKIFGYTECDT